MGTEQLNRIKDARALRIEQHRNLLAGNPEAIVSMPTADISIMFGMGASTFLRDFSDDLSEDPNNKKHYMLTGAQYEAIAGILHERRKIRK